MTEREVWYFLVDGTGQLVEGTSADAVDLPSSSSIRRFRDAVKDKCDRQGDDLKGILASRLLVYTNKENFEVGNALRASDQIGNRGNTEDNALLVVVPEPPTAARPRYFIAPEVQKEVEKAVFLIVEGESNEVGIGMGVFYTPFLAVTCDHNEGWKFCYYSVR